MQHKPRRGYKENYNRLSTISIRTAMCSREKKKSAMHCRKTNRQMIKLEKMIAINIRNDEYTNNIYILNIYKIYI